MNLVPKAPFAVWLTGLPASGKSTIARKLVALLREEGALVVLLDSDELRTALGQEGRHDEQGRRAFYGALTGLAELLLRQHVSVVLAATANLREYRDAARARIPRLVEVFVDTPLKTCMARDPKGIYRAASAGKLQSVPGLQAAYEPPLHPDLTIHGAKDAPDASALAILALLHSALRA